MAAKRPDQRLNLEHLPQFANTATRSSNGSAANSPGEQPAGSAMRYSTGSTLSGAGAGAQLGPGRTGTSSPSKEYGSRLFPKRAREIQVQEGLTPQIWGPPTTGSGHSTPLRETIPESPGSDSFPDFDSPDAIAAFGLAPGQTVVGANRRARAGTVPSRFPAAPTLASMSSVGSLRAASQRQTPSMSPYGPASPHNEQAAAGAAVNAALLSRYRAGSMPQRSGLMPVSGSSSPFGSSIFSSNWMTGRDRASTLQSIRSSDAPSSPRESPAEGDVRTLDYLGLIDAPQGNRSTAAPLTVAEMIAMNALTKNTANRFRSYSVNAKEKYTDGNEYDADDYAQMLESGQLTPASEASVAQAAAIREMVRQHNLEVQAFANFASASRPRARTAGVLDSPTSRGLRSFMHTPSRLESSVTAADYTTLFDAVNSMNLNASSMGDGLDPGTEAPTRSLWLGNIPSSTTPSSLNHLFAHFGAIEFARVLTHKSCGFVNFENIQSAINARAQYNGKELFPGCGPVRIGFAKEQSASNTPGAQGAYPSPSPDPFVGKPSVKAAGAAPAAANEASASPPNLLELKNEVKDIVLQFGASHHDWIRMGAALDHAMAFTSFETEIRPVPEASHGRLHDAPRLREIRKRIDNSSCTPAEIEGIAIDMLPEIAELSSDYLGNTVVQKLFEHCSEETKEAMLAHIVPYLAEIGVHKNGTWAAQKIIDVAHSSTQMSMIVNALRPHSINLFLDQYGNYVMQCCLKFQAPMNDFIFDTMISRLWDVAQGRFGARAMRACLESHVATNDQKRLVAAAIALHSVQLATSSNGALLLTWFLDTCTLPRRRSVLAPRLVPHLVQLCTHKVAYLTVLKVINQRNEPEARDEILQALFFDEQTLQRVISDPACGATFIFKVFTTPFLDDSVRPDCVENVRSTLLSLKAQPTQGYKRLMDEVGLTARHGTTPLQAGSRSSSSARPANGHMQTPDDSQNAYPPMSYGQRMDQAAYDTYSTPMSQAAQYGHSPQPSNPGMAQPMQYQHGMMAQPQQRVPQGPGMYTAPMPYGTASPAMQMVDMTYRGPMPPNMAAYGQQSFAPPMMQGNSYAQYGMPPVQYMHGQVAGNGGRRGRR